MKYLPQIVIAASLLLMVLASLLSACGSAGPIIPVEQSPMLGSVSAAEAGHEAVTTDTVTTDTVTIIEETGYEPTVDVDQVMSSPDYGMQVFLYWREEIADRDLQLVEEAGFLGSILFVGGPYGGSPHQKHERQHGDDCFS